MTAEPFMPGDVVQTTLRSGIACFDCGHDLAWHSSHGCGYSAHCAGLRCPHDPDQRLEVERIREIA